MSNDNSRVHELEFCEYVTFVRCSANTLGTWHTVENACVVVYCPTCEDDIGALLGGK